MKNQGNTEYIKISFDKKLVQQILKILYQRNIQSLIVEGGKQLLDSFITADLWDEAFRFIGSKQFIRGIEAPEISGVPAYFDTIDNDELFVYKNKN